MTVQAETNGRPTTEEFVREARRLVGGDSRRLSGKVAAIVRGEVPGVDLRELERWDITLSLDKSAVESLDPIGRSMMTKRIYGHLDVRVRCEQNDDFPAWAARRLAELSATLEPSPP